MANYITPASFIFFGAILLKGKLKELHSVSTNISYRITLEFILVNKEIILVNVGHHDEVY